MPNSFKVFRQMDTMDCGPACLRMIAAYYGNESPHQYFRDKCAMTREGVSMRGLRMAAESVGMEARVGKTTVDQLSDNVVLPCILLWNSNHYVVCYKVMRKRRHRIFRIADPSLGKIDCDESELRKHWIHGLSGKEQVGIVLQAIPAEGFLKEGSSRTERKKAVLDFMRYIWPFRRRILQLIAGALVVMALSYMTPFLSQTMVDIGISGRNLQFIIAVMVAQFAITVSQTVIRFIQGWLSLHMNTVINVCLISDYLLHLVRLPQKFFDIRTTGDIMQRVGDHARIKDFLMNSLIDVLFSIGIFLVFSVVLAMYNLHILYAFMCGNVIFVAWIVCFLKYRRHIDNSLFSQSAKVQNNMLQFIQGMREIRLNNLGERKLREWEHLQAGMYVISAKAMRMGQIQSSGALLISSLTNITISCMAAKMVVAGSMTMGMMVSLSFIIGQLSAPLRSFISFIQKYQDTKISLERLSDVRVTDEENPTRGDGRDISFVDGDIQLKNVSFSYNGLADTCSLHDVSLTIPRGRITAIVGESGCGKTTLIRLLQGMYLPQEGTISVGSVPLSSVNQEVWHDKTGSVMQDGFIFSDSIADNISLYDADATQNELVKAAKIVKLMDFVSSQPLGFDTKIGDDGKGVSQGERQRVLLARLIYKNPDYVFLDEATNALDTRTEGEIMDNLKNFFRGKTVVMVAHRLNTIIGANQIVVLNKGRIVECGTHEQLLLRDGYYKRLMKKQLFVNG